MKKNQTTIMIPVKPYVKRYLEINYGDPVDFGCSHYFYNHVRRMVKHPSKRFEKVYSERLLRYPTFVRVLITVDDIERFGCELTRTDIVKFNELFTFHVKFLMRSMVGIRVAMGTSVKESIMKFQDRYLFDETVWPYESIVKDFYRNGTPHRIEFEDEIYNKIERIFLEKLSTKKDNLTRFDGFQKIIKKQEENEQSNHF
jgi:hypothetical protein